MHSVPIDLFLQPGGSDASGAGSVFWCPSPVTSVWLAELLAFSVDLGSVTLLPLPVSRQDLTPLGVLILLPAGLRPRRLLRAQPWQVLADRVLLPCGAEPSLPMRDQDWIAVATARWIAIHPAVGCVAFAESDVLRVSELLVPPQMRAEAWNRAVPGLVPVSRITSVSPLEVVELAMLFDAEQREIGTQSPAALPPQPGEAAPAQPAPRPGLRAALARALLGWLKPGEGAAGRAGMFQRLREWGFRPTTARADEEQRQREVQRLLELLAKDPEAGLRFALPLGGHAGRGLATPSNRLGERVPDYNPAGLRGGEPVDAWQIPSGMELALRHRYMLLANQEVGRGNHRRAAYIHAHLLGDLQAAARVLAEGGFAREAAALYLERLNDPAAAARCLVKAGLLTEAAELEARLGHHERAGDLWLILGNAERAKQHYETALRSLQGTGQWLPAALLQAEKLRDGEGALVALQQRWSGGENPQAMCAWFALALRLGKQEAMLRLLTDQGMGPLQTPAAAQVLAAFLRYLPPGELRDATRSQILVVVAQHLVAAEGIVRQRLLESLRRMEPEDKILAEDSRRILRSLAFAVRAKPQRFPDSPIERLGQILLPYGTQWMQAAVADGHLALACGDSPGLIAAMDGNGLVAGFRQELPSVHWISSARRGGRFLLYNHNKSGVLECNPGGAGLNTPDVCPGRNLFAIAVDDDGACWTMDWDGNGPKSLCRHALVGELRSMMTFVPQEIDPRKEQAILVAVRGFLVAASGSVLLLRDLEGEWGMVDLGVQITHLVRSEESDNPCILIGLPRGFLALDVPVGLKNGWLGPGQSHQELDRTALLAGDLERPTLGWTRNGIAIAIDDKTAWLAALRQGRFEKSVEVPFTSGQPRAILPGPVPDQALLLADATVTRVRLVVG